MFSTGSLISQATTRTRPSRATRGYLIPGRWSSTASPEHAFQHRLQEVKESCPDPYPRFGTSSTSVTCSEFRSRYNQLANNETVEVDTVTVNGTSWPEMASLWFFVLRPILGRIRTYRLAGNKLIFFDIVQDGHKVQIMCNLRQLDEVDSSAFKKFYRLLRRGDAFCMFPTLTSTFHRLNQHTTAITGRPHRTGRGELTVLATELPKLLSPCLHDVPVDAREHENSPYARHVQLLADNTTVDIIKARSAIIQYLRQFFVDRSFMEVSTPILNSIAGGASARPFYTSATEFPERQLSLRIAPELWLKRLVVGGFDRVFEIGPSFRNEGELSCSFIWSIQT